MSTEQETADNQDPLPWEVSFAKMLTYARTEAGMTQTELARRATEAGLSFHQQIVQRIENGIRPVRLNEAHVLARIFGMELEELDSALIDLDNAATRAWGSTDHALKTAGHAIRALRESQSQLDAAMREARTSLQQYRQYISEEGQGKCYSTLADIEAAHAKVEWTQGQLRQALEAVTDHNLEPVVGKPQTTGKA